MRFTRVSLVMVFSWLTSSPSLPESRFDKKKKRGISDFLIYLLFSLMLRNRSRAVSTKQALMADQPPNPLILSPPTKPTSPISSFLNSPRFFNGFWKKNQFSDTLETNINHNSNNTMMMIMSPTSILDTKNNNNNNNNNNNTSNNSFVNPFGCDNYALSPKAIGLALIDSIIDDEAENLGKFSKPINRTALFGSKLKVQIPIAAASPVSPNEESPKSPADFGIKTKSSQVSSTPSKESYFTRQLSLKEMELSEDYTRVVIHGPNPKTTHIFDDCIVESCLGDGYEPKGGCEEDDKEMEECVSTSDFMSFCHTCKDVLGQGKDIYIYRGEKAFCSHECRSEEIYYDGMKNSRSDE